VKLRLVSTDDTWAFRGHSRSPISHRPKACRPMRLHSSSQRRIETILSYIPPFPSYCRVGICQVVAFNTRCPYL